MFVNLVAVVAGKHVHGRSDMQNDILFGKRYFSKIIFLPENGYMNSSYQIHYFALARK